MKILAMIAFAMLAGCAQLPRPDAGRQAAFAAAENSYPYLRFLPADYGREAAKKWPVIIFLHGSGERGDDIEKVKVHGPPKLVETDLAFRFVTVSPLLEADGDWDIARLDRTLRAALGGLNVDRKRIYLTGLSRGGHATWRWAAAEPKRFAAIVPIAGRGDPGSACALRDLPVWAFHGSDDTAVPVAGSTDMTAAIERCGGKPKLTIYPGVGHDSWTQSYANPALYDWLDSKRAR